MYQFFAQAVIITLAGATTVALMVLCIITLHGSRNRKWPPLPDEHELERREYDTMLRHRRRARLERELNEQDTLERT